MTHQGGRMAFIKEYLMKTIARWKDNEMDYNTNTTEEMNCQIEYES